MLILFGNIKGMEQQMQLLDGNRDGIVYFFQEILPQIVKYAFVYVIPVIFYVAAFFKLKEREV